MTRHFHGQTPAQTPFRLLRFSAILACLLFLTLSGAARAQHIEYGSPIEIGAGVSAFRMRARPEWTGKHYGSGFVACGLRLYKGLSIRAGREYGRGEEPDPDVIAFGNLSLGTEEGTWTDVTFYGIRYDIPMQVLRQDFLGIDMVCVSAGLLNTRFGVTSEAMRTVDDDVEQESRRNHHLVTMDGRYGEIAARWFLKPPGVKKTDSVIGHYGFDIGFRYGVYPESDLLSDTLMKPASNFNFFQLYLMGFATISFFN